MKHKFTIKNNNPNLLLIFAGWSTDASFYEDISLPGWDILVTWDYSDFEFPLSLLEGYQTVALVAWSFGVFAASVSLPSKKIALSLAINGTPFPVDDDFGIPVRIFEATRSSLSEIALKKFIRRITGRYHENVAAKFDISDIPALKAQLDFICRTHNERKTDSCHNYKQEYKALEENKNENDYVADNEIEKENCFRWDMAYISEGDLIFPHLSQMRAWEKLGVPTSIIKDEPHFTPFRPILASALPDSSKVGLSFSKALSTYDDAAWPQHQIISRLLEMAPTGERKHIVELGAATGSLSRKAANVFHPEVYDLVDLYPLPKFNIAPVENYFIADGEKWIADRSEAHPHSVDAVISANTIQWFIHPDRFFRNVARLLKKDGLFLCSTFLPGNLSELRSVNPYTIVYRNRRFIENFLHQYFTDVTVEEMIIPMQFPSSRELLAHIRLTGVGGGISSKRPLAELLRLLPDKLTYRALLFSAKNR